MQVARLASESMDIARQMAMKGNPNSITDAGVGAMAIRTGVKGGNPQCSGEFAGFER